MLEKIYRSPKWRAGRFVRGVFARMRPVQIIYLYRPNAVSEVVSNLEDALSLSGTSGLDSKSGKIKQLKALQETPVGSKC